MIFGKVQDVEYAANEKNKNFRLL